MTPIQRVLLAATLLLASPYLLGQASESSIVNRLKNLRSVPTAQRPAATTKLALDIRSLPASPKKVELANDLANLSTEGDAGQETLQAVADTLSKALAESPLPAKKVLPPAPYQELASLVRYKQVTTDLKDPLLEVADQILVANDADVAKADFTLKDMHGKNVTLSELRGKIVMVNFWATWCPPCRLEMPDLDWIYTHFQSQGLVILSITDEEPIKVASFLGAANYHPPVLLDYQGKVHKQFHVEGIPKTYIFDRDGKLIAETIDQCTGQQFLRLLSKTDLKP